MSVLDSILASLPVEKTFDFAPDVTTFGTDLVCSDDLTPTMDEEDGEDPAVVARSVFRRLITPHGGLIDEPVYGRDLRFYLSKPMTKEEQLRLPQLLEAEIKADDRIDSRSVSVKISESVRGTFEIAVMASTAKGPFTLTAIYDGAIILKEVTK